MTGTLTILAYYFTWQRFLRWLLVIGVMLLILPSLYLLEQGGELNDFMGPILLCGACLLLTPFVMASRAFRDLISNPRLCLVPHLPLQAGIALLLITFLAAGYLPAATALLGVSGNLYSLPMLFIATSVYLALDQFLQTTRFIGATGLLPLLVLILARQSEFTRVIATNASVHLPLLALTVLGWALSLRRLARGGLFAPTYRDIFRQHGKMPDFSWLPDRLRFGSGMTPGGTLLWGYPNGLYGRSLLIVLWGAGLPALCALLISLLDLGSPDPFRLDRFLGIFLVVSALLNGQGSIMSGEVAARARLLWLRRAGGRAEQWRFMEREVMINLALLLLLTVAIAVVLLTSGVSTLLLLNYCGFVLSYGLYTAYFALCARIHHWPDLFTLIMVTAMLLILVALAATGMAQGNTFILNLMEAFLLLLAGLLRNYSRRGFLEIDWRKVKPEIWQRNSTRRA